MRLLILDACVLIDFCDVDECLLRTIGRQVGTLYVAAPVLEEVGALTEARISELGIELVEPPLELMLRAAREGGTLSFQDRICIELADMRGWTCVTNDGALRKACQQRNVPVMWSLQMLKLAVDAQALTVDEVEQVAWDMHQSNPYITKALVKRFVTTLRERPTPKRRAKVPAP